MNRALYTQQYGAMRDLFFGGCATQRVRFRPLAVRYETVRDGIVLCGAIPYDTVQYDTVRSGEVALSRYCVVHYPIFS